MTLNKDVKGLPKYVSEHVLTTLNPVETQKIGEIMEYLKAHYRRTRLEKIKDLVVKWMNFRDDNFDDEDDCGFPQEIVAFSRGKVPPSIVLYLNKLDKSFHIFIYYKTKPNLRVLLNILLC